MNFRILFSCFIFCCFAAHLAAQADWKPVALSTATGFTVDSSEKQQYGIFTFWKKEEFDSAQCFVRPDSSFVIEGWMKNNSTVLLNCTRKEFYEIAWVVNYRAGIIQEEPFDWFGFLAGLSEAMIKNSDHCRKK